MTVAVADKTDVQHLLKAGATPEEGKALLDALMNGQVTSIFEKLKRDERPALLPVPERVRGFRVRLDLHGAKPPVWRRLELPGDLTLPQVHDAIQAGKLERGDNFVMCASGGGVNMAAMVFRY